MKYVVFRRPRSLTRPALPEEDQTETYVPVILPEHASHAEAQLLDGGIPDSAGFFSLANSGRVIIYEQRSASLDLGPKPNRDAQFLHDLLGGYGIESFRATPSKAL